MQFNSNKFKQAVLSKRAGATLRVCSKEAGISAATLSRIEGGGVPDIATFAKCCGWMQVAPETFFKGNKSVGVKAVLKQIVGAIVSHDNLSEDWQKLMEQDIHQIEL